MLKKYCFIDKTNYLWSISVGLTYSILTTNSKKSFRDNTITYDLKAINWFSIDDNGFILCKRMEKIEDRPAIYIYK